MDVDQDVNTAPIITGILFSCNQVWVTRAMTPACRGTNSMTADIYAGVGRRYRLAYADTAHREQLFNKRKTKKEEAAFTITQ